ncbi:MAG TPA: hypothetical protein VGL44_12400 [Gaiellales bacterium]|jgi:hypothetical protein
MAKPALLALVLSSVVLGGCRSTSAATSAGDVPSAHPIVAPAWSPRIRGWERMLHAAARHDPATIYPTPSRSVFRERLAHASSEDGFRVGAQSSRGTPFLDVSNVMRAHGGGQWARSERLYPYPHG